ncbi:TetR family transcriptional regulator [Propionicimonas sp.]|uniref:TetR/AcrR family transcriptional regulator n=1 Tax=Propionicimonas sp. TaxID=1955623 RepID=UPI0039E2C233
MIERDAEATRQRLLAAATIEFSQYGIAGARVDRIAAAARSNKAQIYHYFGSKNGLFDAVFGGHAQAAVEQEYFDASDLPGTAGWIFDNYEEHPELGRLVLWYRLERAGDAASIAALERANLAKIEKIRAAQEAGLVTDRFPPAVLLGLILTLTAAWTALPPEFAVLEREVPAGDRRGYVVAAVRRLVEP